MRFLFLALSLLPCFVHAQNEMWNHLATSPYRLDTADVHALKVELDQQFDLIFIDAAKGQYINFFD